MADPLKPSASLLARLGSIIVHAQELISENGHSFDKDAFIALLDDGEVHEWMQEMDKLALLPKKR